MRGRLVLVLCSVALVATLCTGCLFNVFETARAIGAGNVALVFGTGVLSDFSYMTPQARLGLGLANGGALWLGAIGDLKVGILDDPTGVALSVALGGGYSIEYGGSESAPGLFAELLFEYGGGVVPVYYVYPEDDPTSKKLIVGQYTPGFYLTYQPSLVFEGEAVSLLHHFVAGTRIALSQRARLLLQVDARPGIGGCRLPKRRPCSRDQVLERPALPAGLVRALQDS